jgi:hypothetical protein
MLRSIVHGSTVVEYMHAVDVVLQMSITLLSRMRKILQPSDVIFAPWLRNNDAYGPSLIGCIFGAKGAGAAGTLGRSHTPECVYLTLRYCDRSVRINTGSVSTALVCISVWNTRANASVGSVCVCATVQQYIHTLYCTVLYLYCTVLYCTGRVKANAEPMQSTYKLKPRCPTHSLCPSVARSQVSQRLC